MEPFSSILRDLNWYLNIRHIFLLELVSYIQSLYVYFFQFVLLWLLRYPKLKYRGFGEIGARRPACLDGSLARYVSLI
jgi:hypothetical protein